MCDRSDKSLFPSVTLSLSLEIRVLDNLSLQVKGRDMLALNTPRLWVHSMVETLVSIYKMGIKMTQQMSVRPSGILCGVGWQLITDVSGQHIGPAIKSHAD
jgi:hypothetical protein